jgi:hypothetical protein
MPKELSEREDPISHTKVYTVRAFHNQTAAALMIAFACCWKFCCDETSLW